MQRSQLFCSTTCLCSYIATMQFTVTGQGNQCNYVRSCWAPTTPLSVEQAELMADRKIEDPGDILNMSDYYRRVCILNTRYCMHRVYSSYVKTCEHYSAIILDDKIGHSWKKEQSRPARASFWLISILYILCIHHYRQTVLVNNVYGMHVLVNMYGSVGHFVGKGHPVKCGFYSIILNAK